MASFVRFPKVGANIEEGMVGAWRKNEGDAVEKGEALVELITDKATFDLEAEESGSLFKIIATEKSTVPINYVLAVLGENGADLVSQARAENERLLAEYRARAAAGWGEGAAKRSSGKAPGRVRATPAARRAARKAAVRLEDVAPFARGKVIGKDDVRRYLAAENRTEAGANDH